MECNVEWEDPRTNSTVQVRIGMTPMSVNGSRGRESYCCCKCYFGFRE